MNLRDSPPVMSPSTFTCWHLPSNPFPLPIRPTTPLPLPWTLTHTLAVLGVVYVCGSAPHFPNPARGYFYAGLVFTALSSVLFLDASKPNPQLLSAITFELSFPSLILPSTSFLAPGTNVCWWSDQRSPGRSSPLQCICMLRGFFTLPLLSTITPVVGEVDLRRKKK